MTKKSSRRTLEDTPTGQLAAEAIEPDEFEQAEREERETAALEQRQAQLDAFAAALAKKRKAAVDGRRMSGIEEIWAEDEEFYEGIDDANRDETVTRKPRSQTGGASVVESAASSATGSTVFLNITRAYVDFSAGRAADMLLPTDDRNWDLLETPMPDVIKAFNDQTPLQVPGSPLSTIGAAAKEMVAEAKAKVEKAKTRIEDWHEEGQFQAEQRKMLRDAAKAGVAVLKGPFPVKKMARAINRDENGAIKLEVQNKTAPVSKCINYRNFYPDPACGEDIHSGSHVWEKDAITARKLRDLKGTADADGNAMYIESAIDACLMEGPQKKFEGDTTYQAPDAEQFEIWYFHGVASAEDLAAAGVTLDKEGDVLPVMVTMVNDRVIKAALSTLDSGAFPYDVMVWQPREGHWAGIGVARQVRAPQRIINAGTRNMMDNAGRGAGPQFVLNKHLKPMGKNATYSIEPGKFWKLDDDSEAADVTKAFAAVIIPMVTDELMSIIQFALKMAEDVTGLPMLMQGQQGRASETVGGMQMLSNNSNTPLRAIAKQYDDMVTVPHLLRYYEWLLMYGPEEDEKGEFIVAARGSSALFERDAQNQAILQMAPIVENPRYKINPEKWFSQFLKAQRLDPANFQYSDAEWAQIEEQQQSAPAPQDPRIEAANIAAQASVKREEIKAEVVKERIAKDTDRDTVYVQAEQSRAENDHAARMAELEMKRELAMLDYANKRELTLEQVKAKLADTAMKLQTQKELSALSEGMALHRDGKAAKQVATPPTEPAGRAAPGRAYQE